MRTNAVEGKESECDWSTERGGRAFGQRKIKKIII